jgi:hypothetical protein
MAMLPQLRDPPGATTMWTVATLHWRADADGVKPYLDMCGRWCPVHPPGANGRAKPPIELNKELRAQEDCTPHADP